MPRIYSIRPTLSLKGRRFQGLRGFTGKPFHPPLTDFPIVCYTLAAVFDLISYFSQGYGDLKDPAPSGSAPAEGRGTSSLPRRS